jgi:aldose 1-epimerase
MTISRDGLAVLCPALAFAVFISNCVCSSQAQIKPEAFHRTIDGSQVGLYTLKNSNGLEAKITNYGGIVVSLAVPDKNGKLGDVVLGYDTLNDYHPDFPTTELKPGEKYTQTTVYRFSSK